MIKKLIAFVSLAMLLSAPAKSAETCKIEITSDQTLTQYLKQIQTEYAGSIAYSTIDKIAEKHKLAIAIGMPVCNIAGNVPVSNVMASTNRDDEIAELYFYLMRGKEEDVKHVIDLMTSKYKSLTDEERANFKGPHYYGWSGVWEDGDFYLVLGQHELGYDPIERSLHLLVGKKEWFAKEYSK